jgi:asparagine synthase (glutamine-hydrolysing)
MCGICGILDPRGDRRERDRRVVAMSSALKHRGPDDVGTFADQHVSLGFRRLAVIDLETGQQPIRLEDERAVIVLNGEIYNFRELRSELESRHRFRTRGDVEVVLKLFSEEGVEGLRRLNGMFALAIWDVPARTLFLARDRFGVKPLFLFRTADGYAFASETRALLAGGFPPDRELNRVELHHYLHQKYVSPGGSMVRGIRSLRPGTVLEVSATGEREYRYWDPPAAVDEVDDVELTRRLESCLEQAAERQLVADVPVGVFLSGGLDSSTLTALVAKRSSVVRTFSVGFRDGDVANELPAARQVAQALGTEHRELVMNAGDVAADLDQVLGALDEPLGDATCIPTWYMSRLARSEVVVALSGEGADEIFAGYPRQVLDLWMERLGPGRRLVPATLRLSGRRVSERLKRRLRMPPGVERQLDWSRVFTADGIEALTVDPLPPESEVLALHPEMTRRWAELAARDPLNARLEVDRLGFLPGDLLPKVDRMSMAHSLEVRVPYLDNEVADLVLPLPGRTKVSGTQGKVLLRKVAARVLPGPVAARPKQGFDVPISSWLRGPLRGAMTDLLSESTIRAAGLFRPEVVTRLVTEHLEGVADHGEPLWLLVALEGWRARVLGSAVSCAP